MQLVSKQQVPLLTAVLSIVSLGLVFSAVGGVVPEWLLPRSEGLIALVPHLNVVFSIAAIVTIISGWRAIKQGNVESHRNWMLASFGLFAAFLVFYLYRVALEGPQAFGGPETIRQFVYLPTLAIHILLAVICVPLLFYVLLVAVSRPIDEIYLSRHRSVGQIAAALWLVSFSLGIVVYVLLYVLY